MASQSLHILILSFGELRISNINFQGAQIQIVADPFPVELGKGYGHVWHLAYSL